MSSPEAIANPIVSPLVLKRVKIQGIEIPPEVQQFCIKNNLSGPLDLAQGFLYPFLQKIEPHSDVYK